VQTIRYSRSDRMRPRASADGSVANGVCAVPAFSAAC
jgi:hypothetical protein